MIDHRVRSRAWPLTLPSVHRLAVMAENARQAAVAACLWSAPGGLVSYQTAGELWGLEGILAA
jgi:hypothetical protein